MRQQKFSFDMFHLNVFLYGFFSITTNLYITATQ